MACPQKVDSGQPMISPAILLSKTSEDPSGSALVCSRERVEVLYRRSVPWVQKSDGRLVRIGFVVPIDHWDVLATAPPGNNDRDWSQSVNLTPHCGQRCRAAGGRTQVTSSA